VLLWPKYLKTFDERYHNYSSHISKPLLARKVAAGCHLIAWGIYPLDKFYKKAATLNYTAMIKTNRLVPIPTDLASSFHTKI
jgi:deoxyribodipyrimidine photo-lyase